VNQTDEIAEHLPFSGCKLLRRSLEKDGGRALATWPSVSIEQSRRWQHAPQRHAAGSLCCDRRRLRAIAAAVVGLAAWKLFAGVAA